MLGAKTTESIKVDSLASRQFSLPLSYLPTKVKAHGLRDAHPFPLVSKGKAQRFMSSFRVPAEKAWTYPSIELRAGNSWPSLILDLDDEAALMELYRLIQCEGWPEFNWKVQRVVNGHSHVVWNLADPVHRGADARQGPLNLLARVSEYYTAALKADRGYTGVLTHNPMSAAHGPGFKTHWLRRDPYKLGELARVLPFGWRIPEIPATGIGRNNDLFRAMMQWAGSPANLHNSILAAAVSANQQFDDPLPAGEVSGLAASVEKYRRRWIAKGKYYTSEQRRLWGQERQARGAARRRARGKLDERDKAIRESGLTNAELAAEFGLSIRQLQRIRNSGKPSGPTAEWRACVLAEIEALRDTRLFQ